ncbi:MAG TPA: efflux RND transporter periplasmic adaptor subunit [Candidatus Aminicenantes bacterium]|nr:efflux RND transporter periplasmic adaptor subunit [Candidatus Aminicenantes bacterium]HRY64193.1 efflux RND transporter periplasmic adaptor subunit [Candidatus Aminicenantes bacterium]HRZ71106.1 efflux RND transporter periplasmic adaptor subunit [Candidatus Aminicenantes bacterium]
MKKKVLWMIIALVVVAGVILGLTVLKGGKKNEVKYRTETLGRGDIEATVVTSGTLNPIDTIDIGAQVSGKVTKLYADFNTPVKTGDIVAELDQEQLRMKIQQNEASYRTRTASLEQAKVTLQTTEKAYERAKALFAKSLLSVEEMDSAEANYLSAKSSLVSAEASLSQAKSSLDQSKVDLSYAIIRSPVDGVVITRKVSLGQTLQSGFNVPVLFQVATDLTKMKVECDVDESDIGKVKEGQNVRFGVEAYPDESFHGVVQQVRVSPTTTNNVVTYTIIVNVDNPEKKLLPGMTATASIIVGEAKNVLRVPNGALRFTPTLTEAEMKKMQEEMRQRFMAQRPAQGGQPGQPGAANPGMPGAPPAGSPGGPGGQPAAARQGGQNRPQMPRVWVQEKDGKLRMAMLRTGVSDTNYSEIVRGDLKEGDVVVLGTQGSTDAAGNQMNRMGGMMFMGGPPGGRR